MALGAGAAVFVGAWKMLGIFVSSKKASAPLPEEIIMAEISSLKLAVATLQEQQREAERREERAERVRAEIFHELRLVGQGVAEIKGALGLPGH